MDKRTVCYDNDLQIEACRFQGIMQKFPNHFHEYYVIGFVKSGRRLLTCKNQTSIIYPGDLLLFNPRVNHACEQLDDQALDWCSLNISTTVMKKTAAGITGKNCLPEFTAPVVRGSEAVTVLAGLHDMIMEKETCLKKEETFYCLIEQLILEYTKPVPEQPAEVSADIQAVCTYIESHFGCCLSLNDLSHIAGLNKYVLLKKFTRQQGITPYQYLSAVRINQAKLLLESGIVPSETALRCGFSDQSHFTRFFKTFTGLTPKSYQNIFINQEKSTKDGGSL